MRQMRSIRESELHPGAHNMAVDCAIAEAVGDAYRLPTLRLYGWSPFCLSLGYGQRAREADTVALRQRGWDMVRRPTGGKAILHGDELTYSLSLPLDHVLASGDVVESYRRISVGLLRALECLGLSAAAERNADSSHQDTIGPVCFEMSSHYEIKVDGRKLIGSAQVRRKGVMMQHGTIPLWGDVARICDVLVFDSEGERVGQKLSVCQHAITLSQALGRSPGWQEVASALEQGFAEAFDLELVPGTLSEREHERAEILIMEQYGNPDWTNKR